MITEVQIQELLNKYTPECVYFKNDFEEMTREEVKLQNNWEKRMMKRFWKYAEMVAKGRAKW